MEQHSLFVFQFNLKLKLNLILANGVKLDNLTWEKRKLNDPQCTVAASNAS